MEKQPTRVLVVVMILSLLMGLSAPSYAQSKGGKNVADYTSIATLSGTGEGKNLKYTNPYTNTVQESFAGVIKGTLNGHAEKFYCIDLQHALVYNQDYWDEGNTPSEITYILNNYFPYKTSYAGKLSNNNEEAAAIQVAIWHFSDGVDETTITNNNNVKNRATAIINDALSNANLNEYLETLLIVPASQYLVQGSTASFEVYAMDLNNNPVENVQIQLTTNLGTLSATTVTTDALGKAGPITLTYSSTGVATVKAKADVIIPQGTKYVHKTSPNSKQKLVLATPSFDTKEVYGTVEWYKPADCDTKGFTTYTQGGWGSPSNSTPGKIRDLYFNTVFPSGLTIGGTYKLTLTSATAVKNYLPDGGTAAAYTQNYTNPTSNINVLSGQLTALKLNVYYDAAGYLGTNSTQLGDLIIASGPFAGYTVYNFLAFAEQAIGGGSLNGFTFSQINDAATAINENFDNGTVDKGFLTCAPDCENKIGNFIWHDIPHGNNAPVNGIQDADEPGIPGVVVELLDQNGTLLQTTTTNASGYYEFAGMADGLYKVRIAASNFLAGGVFYGSQSEKWFITYPNKGTDDKKDSDGDKTTMTATVTVNCENDETIDFGFFKVCVGLDKTGPASVNVGEKITYTFTVTNCGDLLLAGGANVYDPMLNPSGDNKIKYLQLYPGEVKTFTFEYTTDQNDCGTLVNNAWVIGHPSLNNYNFNGQTVRDDASHSVDVVCVEKKADLEIEKSASTSSPQCDDQISYTIKVKNNGPDKSEGIEVTDLLPQGAIFLSSTATQGSYDNNTGIWTIGDLNSGATATLTINVKIDCDQVNGGVFDLGIAKDFNLFVFEDVNQPSSDTQGKAAIGGNAYFANYSIGDLLPPNSGDVLIVGGRLDFMSGRVYNGNVVFGNTTNLVEEPLPPVSVDGTVYQGNPIDFNAAESYFQTLSATLAGYTANGTVTFQWGGLNLNGTDPYLNVFDVNGADLSGANNVEINAPNGSVVLVNINGTTITWAGGLTVNGTAITNVLYNFHEASMLTISNIDVTGSILAPYADVNFISGVQNGQMICKSLEGMGQFNWSQFLGNIPYEKEITNVALISKNNTVDPNTANNSDFIKIIVTNQSTGSNGNNGNGSNWQQVGGFAAGEIVYTLAYDGNIIYAGTWGGKIYKSTDGGANWTRINFDMNVGYIWSLQISGGTIFAATEQGVFKYDGSSWLLTSLNGIDVHALAVMGGTIYAGTWGRGIYYSIDGGSNWTELNSGLDFPIVQSLAINSGSVFAATYGGGVYKLNGTSWIKLNVGNDFVWALGANGSGLFAGTYGGGLFRSLDGGASWSHVSNLNAPFIYSIAVDAAGKVYVASWTSGVFYSNDNGTTWTALGMGGFGVSSLLVGTNSDDLLVGTKEGKIFKSVIGEVTSVEDGTEIPTEFELSQNYPNPFNPSTTIQFSIPVAGKYTLKVYNILGQEVATLLEQEINSGVHKVTFNANQFASGVYVYRLTGSNVNLSKKMLLMK